MSGLENSDIVRDDGIKTNVSCSGTFSAVCESQPVAGTIAKIDGGPVTVVRDGQEYEAGEGFKVRYGDTIMTGDSRISLGLNDGTQYDLKAGAELRVDDFVFGADGTNPMTNLLGAVSGLITNPQGEAGSIDNNSNTGMGIRG